MKPQGRKWHDGPKKRSTSKVVEGVLSRNPWISVAPGVRPTFVMIGKFCRLLAPPSASP
jgi:hypothetical protein